jgi:hypothetical protein
MAKYTKELEDMLCEELDKIAKKGELTAGSLDVIQKLTHSLKSLKTIEAMEESGYSGGMYPMYRYSYDMDGGNSYAMQRRDSMGRYSRTGYSRDEGFAHELRALMDEAPNDRIKRKMQTIVSELEG